MTSRGALTAFQVEVAQIFFSLPAAEGFLLAGGAALIAHGLIDRPTRDLDVFTRPDAGGVPGARDALERAVAERGWASRRILTGGWGSEESESLPPAAPPRGGG
jgi:hypothetical protein